MAVAHAAAFWVTAAGRGEIRAQALPRPGPDDVVVRATYSAISRGTESLVFTGRVPPSQHDRMRAPFQEGDFSFPVKYGYLSVGIVEHGPPDLLERAVFCLHPHQTRYVVPAAAVTPLPEGVPPARAVLAGNLETAVNALWDAPVRVGDRVAVVGAGVVGCLVARLAGQVPGARVQVVDVRRSRAAAADRLGVGFGTPEEATGGCDLVVHASATESGLRTALNLLGDEGTLLELSWYGDRAVAVPLGEAFHSRRLTVRASQVGQVPPDRQPRWSRRRRLCLALELLRDPVFDVLFTGESGFADLPATMSAVTGDAADVLCHRIRYDDTPIPADDSRPDEEGTRPCTP